MKNSKRTGMREVGNRSLVLGLDRPGSNPILPSLSRMCWSTWLTLQSLSFLTYKMKKHFLLHMVIERVKWYEYVYKAPKYSTKGIGCSINYYYCQILIMNYNFPWGQPSPWLILAGLLLKIKCHYRAKSLKRGQITSVLQTRFFPLINEKTGLDVSRTPCQPHPYILFHYHCQSHLILRNLPRGTLAPCSPHPTTCACAHTHQHYSFCSSVSRDKSSISAWVMFFYEINEVYNSS